MKQSHYKEKFGTPANSVSHKCITITVEEVVYDVSLMVQ